MRCEGNKTYAKAGTCPVCQMYLEKEGESDTENHPLSVRDYRMDLKFPKEVVAAKPTRIEFIPRKTSDNSPLKELESVHGTEMDVYIVTQELSDFVHLRPLRAAEGVFQTEYTFKFGGNYILFVSITPKGKPRQIFPLAMKVGGPTKQTSPLIVKGKTSLSVAGFQVSTPGRIKIKAGEKIQLPLLISRKKKHEGGPILKEYGYLTAISEDTTKFITSHAAIQSIQPTLWKYVPELKFPKPGKYRLFVELWNADVNAAFVVEVF